MEKPFAVEKTFTITGVRFFRGWMPYPTTNGVKAVKKNSSKQLKNILNK